MKEPQYKPITGMINVNDIQEIIESNRYYQEEIERLKEEYMMLQNASDEVEEEKDKEIERLKRLANKDYTELNILELKNFDYKRRIDKAIEYIEENKRTYENDEYCFDDMIDEVTPLLDILKGCDKE